MPDNAYGRANIELCLLITVGWRCHPRESLTALALVSKLEGCATPCHFAVAKQSRGETFRSCGIQASPPMAAWTQVPDVVRRPGVMAGPSAEEAGYADCITPISLPSVPSARLRAPPLLGLPASPPAKHTDSSFPPAEADDRQCENHQ
jgi:hypothetical protein